MLPPILEHLNPDGSGTRGFDQLGGGKFKNDPEWTQKMIRGSALTPTKARGLQLVDAVRDKVKTRNGVSFLIDILSLDIQRGRDHGLLSYGGMRDDFDLSDLGTDFSSFGPLADDLKDLYGDTNNMDLIIGIMG